ncbi:hypothetical protein ACFQX7_26205 [Luedemannella flava]
MVVTGNHYWLDAAVAVLLLGLVIAALPRAARRAPWRSRAPACTPDPNYIA